jgi:Domain of unknown function (DUF4326)
MLTDRVPRVLNKHKDPIPPDAVSVMRPSEWGNPFKFPSFYAYQSREVKLALRKASVDRFRRYLDEHPHLKEEARKALKGRDLICCCAPLPCHGDVWLEVANA